MEQDRCLSSFLVKRRVLVCRCFVLNLVAMMWPNERTINTSVTRVLGQADNDQPSPCDSPNRFRNGENRERPHGESCRAR